MYDDGATMGDTPTAEPAASGPPPLSVLDLAMVPQGASSGDALAATTALARRAEELGYTRFWVAEHHNMATVASTSPPVLMAHLAASTSTINVGSGGVMLPNHAPLAVAEQFALLEALHPGRIDLGIGRAPVTDRATAVALRRTTDHREEEQFPRNVIDVMGLLGDRRTDDGLWDRFRATPDARTWPNVILLGSSAFSAQLAGVLGLPFAFAHHFDMGGTTQAVSVYREYFEPSAVLDAPKVIVTASVVAAPTAAEAEHLAGPFRLSRHGLRTGRPMPMLPPDEAAAHPDFATATSTATRSIVGSATEAAAGLAHLAAQTEADELMINTATHGLDDRLRSLELVADAWAGRSAPSAEVA
ncbi:MAG: LLM class flavin-dependent oxidoreductase [Actinomycetota bacterium]